MNSPRLTILPDAGLSELGSELAKKAVAAANATGPAELPALLDPLMRGCIEQFFSAAGAQEGTLWLLDPGQDRLVAAYNSAGEEFVGFEQPRSRGLIGMVVATEQPVCENEAYRHRAFSGEADQRVGRLTCAMIAVPLYFGDGIRGVVSCVQQKEGESDPDPPGFGPEDLAAVELLAELLGRLMDARIAAALLGAEQG